MAELVEAAVVNEARRLATVRRVRQLLPGEVAVFDGLCRLATGLLRADAAVVAFLTDSEQVFLGRDGIEVATVPRAIPVELLRTAFIDIADLSLMDIGRNCPLVSGQLNSFRGAVAAPIRFEGQPIGLLTCYFRAIRDAASPTDVAHLTDLRDIAERLIVQESALTAVARTAVLAIDGTAEA